MRKPLVSAFLAAVTFAVALPVGAGVEIPYHRTSDVPVTYMRDYAGGHPYDEDFIATVAANPPELLVVGKDSPIQHNWGPVAGTGGENQAFGQGEHIRRISAEELREKTEKIRTMVSRLHDAGVRWVMPYICTMTIGGLPDKRTGFWEFYDHWDEYAEFGIGPRPEEDPLEWMQRSADGSILTYYELKLPRYLPNYRWAACIHQPGWRQHLGNVVRLSAEVGYDGVYMDNNRSTRCHGDRCQAAFREYLARRLTPKELRRDLGVDRLEEVRLDPHADPYLREALNTAHDPSGDPQLSPKADLYLTKLSWEFWTDSKIDFLRELKAIGERARGGEFHIFANTTAYTKGAYEPSRVSAVASFNQSEENGGFTGAHPGLLPPGIGEPAAGPAYNRRAYEYKFNQSVANGMRVGMLTRPGHGPDTAPGEAIGHNPQTAALSIAESAAFGGGGAYKVQIRWDRHHAISRWRGFFEQHPDLYEGGEIWAPIGVIAFGEQFYCGLDKTHQEATRQLGSALAENGVLFDLVHEAQFSLDRMKRFRALVVPPGVRSLSPEQWHTFRRYVQEGHGELFIMGEDFATYDHKCRPWSGPDRIPGGAALLPAEVTTEDLLNTLSRAIGRSAISLTNAAGEVPAGVGVNAYLNPAQGSGGRIMVHLVNYNVPLGSERDDPPRPLEKLVASVPLPPNWRVTSVEGFSPYSEENLDVTFEQDEGTARLRIPKLHLYQAIRISGEPDRIWVASKGSEGSKTNSRNY